MPHVLEKQGSIRVFDKLGRTSLRRPMSDLNPIDPPVTYRFGPFRLSVAQRSLKRDDTVVNLGSRAFDLLCTLVREAGRVVSNRELVAAAWPNSVVEDANLRVQLAALRKGLGDWQSGKPYFVNVPQRGYCFVAPITQEAPSPDEPKMAESRPPALSENAAEHNLPVRPTQLIGRDETIASLVELLPLRKFISLVGPGGVGKTSVALAVATELLTQCPDGVRFVDLTSLSAGSRVATALAAAIGIQVLSEDPTPQVLQWIAGRNMVLLLDNCEHVIDDAAAFAEALTVRSASVLLLVTSREPLRVSNEWIHRLSPLSTPPEAEDMSLTEALSYPAVELFAARARSSFSDHAFTEADALVLAGICRKLDGLPLAIELVAARVDTFDLEALSAQLDSQLYLLNQGRRTALPRQRNLRATLDWSYQLLLPDERSVLSRVSVFRERFSTEAARMITGDLSTDLTSVLASLVHKSLISADSSQTVFRYRLLETTRNYANEQLEKSGEALTIARRHAEWCLQELTGAETARNELGPLEWRARYTRRLDDLRAALKWAWGERSPLVGIELVVAAISPWFNMGMMNECREQLSRALSYADAIESMPSIELRLQVDYGFCLLVLYGRTPQVDAALARAKAISSKVGEPQLVLRALWTSYTRFALVGDYSAALAEAASFGVIARASEDRAGVFVFHRMMALITHLLGDQALALSHGQKALHPDAMRVVGVLHVASQTQDHRSAALTNQARALWLRGQPDDALETAEAAYQAALDTRHALPVSYALGFCSCAVSLWSGRLDTAKSYIQQLIDVENRHSITYWLNWPRIYRQALELRQSGGTWHAGISLEGLNQAHLDMLATMDVGFQMHNGMQRVAAGQSAWCAPEIIRAHGLTLIDESPVEAERLFSESIALADAQGALGWKLRGAISLAKLWQSQGKNGEAKALLQEVLASFTQGHQTADLLTATALFAEGNRSR